MKPTMALGYIIKLFQSAGVDAVMRKTVLLLLYFLIFEAAAEASQPLFPNSVASNNLEFIRTDDNSVFCCLTYEGTNRAEMPDKRNDELFVNGAFIYLARYEDGSSVELWAHPDLGSPSLAKKHVEPVANAIGKLPSFMRSKLNHVVIHRGDESAFGESEGHFFVLYSDNIQTRIDNHDLEETVFHESVHATLDSKYRRSSAWRNAQRDDNAFITQYAANNPNKEDMAESALFAWAALVHPGRLPHQVETQVRQLIPNRLAFFKSLFIP
jgi:hypothetical protein